MKKLVIAGALVALTALVVPSTAHAGTPVLVGEDAAGDWGAVGGAPEASPAGSAVGQDLVAAEVLVDEGTTYFTISLAEMPPNGGMPEVTRYTWNIDLVDGDQKLNSIDLDGKYTNVSRGTCDPTAGNCPPPRDPTVTTAAPFALRGNCRTQGALPPPSPTPGTNLTLCQEFALVSATFDPSALEIRIPVPTSALVAAAEQCSFEIAAGTNIFGGFLSAMPSAFLTSSAMPMDVMEASFTETGLVTAPVNAC